MLHKISEKIACFFFDSNDEYPLEVYIYGIELMVSSFIGTVLVFGLGVISGYIAESIIFMLSLSAVRIFSGGYHANTYLKCNIIFVISAIFSFLCYKLYVLYLLQFNSLISGILLLLSLTAVVFFAPVENVNKKINDSDRGKFKMLSAVVLFFEFLLCMLTYSLFRFYQVLIVLPTVFVVDISILVEIILRKRRKKNDEHEEGFEEGS